jgi:Ca-activated chloride channel family protein
MKTIIIIVAIVWSAFVAEAQMNQPVQKPSGEDWSTSPRLLVQNGTASEVELASTIVTTSIVGTIADVNVRQVYINHGILPLDAVYVFPGSTRAAVYAMTMTIGRHSIRAIVREKEQARREYVTAKEQGRSASLLEMLKPNIFRMNVANVRSGDSIVIDMRYTEAISLADGVYEFVYPAVVAPRYVGAVQNEVNAAISNANLPTEIPGKFTISVMLSTGVPLQSVESPSHTLNINGSISAANQRTNTKKNSTKIEISDNDKMKKNRDFVLRYVLSGRSIESGLLLFKGEKENYFMLMAQPPRNVEIASVLPREFVFIVDVSGSMNGFPLLIANRLMDSLLTVLRPNDKFNIMTFSGGSSVLSDKSILASRENITRGRIFLKNNSNGGGGTELLPALQRALKMPVESNYARSFVVITDGFVSIEREAFKLVRENLNKANVYAFGIGSTVNRYLMEGLARAGNADPMIVTNQSEAPAMADKFKQYIEAPVLTNIHVDYGNLDVYDVEPSAIADVTARRPIIVFGKWRGKPTGNVELTGTTADGALDSKIDIGASPILPEHSALKYLWARNKITMIEDESNQNPNLDESKTITNIGLQYNILTRYTSFVAIDSITPLAVQKSIVLTPKLTIDTNRYRVYNSAIKHFSKDNTKGNYDNSQIEEGSVKPNHIYDSVRASQKLRRKSATSAKILDGSVQNTNIDNTIITNENLTTLSSQASQNRLLMGWGPTASDSIIWLNQPTTTEQVLHWDGSTLNWTKGTPALNTSTASDESNTQTAVNRNKLLIGIDPVSAGTMGWLNSPTTNGYVLRYNGTTDVIEWAANNKLFFPIDGDTTIDLSLAPAMVRLTNRGNAPTLILNTTDVAIASQEPLIIHVDTTPKIVSVDDSIRVQSGLSEPIINQQGRTNEHQKQPRETAMIGRSNSYNSNGMSDPLIPSSSRPRLYLGIISMLNTAWLSNYKPNGLYRNQHIELSREARYTFSVGLRGDYLLGDVKNSISLISADVLFGRLGFQYSAQDSVLSTASERISGNYALSTKASELTLNLLFNQRIPGIRLFYIFGGISTNYVFNIEHSYSVSASKPILPNSLVTEISDSGRTVHYSDPSTAAINNLQFGLIGGLRYDLYIARNSFLSIFSQFSYGLTGIIKGGNERPIVLRAGVAWTSAF